MVHRVGAHFCPSPSGEASPQPCAWHVISLLRRPRQLVLCIFPRCVIHTDVGPKPHSGTALDLLWTNFFASAHGAGSPRTDFWPGTCRFRRPRKRTDSWVSFLRASVEHNDSDAVLGMAGGCFSASPCGDVRPPRNLGYFRCSAASGVGLGSTAWQASRNKTQPRRTKLPTLMSATSHSSGRASDAASAKTLAALGGWGGAAPVAKLQEGAEK